MSIAQDFISELEYELPATRRLLERVPSDKGPWTQIVVVFELQHAFGEDRACSVGQNQHRV